MTLILIFLQKSRKENSQCGRYGAMINDLFVLDVAEIFGFIEGICWWACVVCLRLKGRLLSWNISSHGDNKAKFFAMLICLYAFYFRYMTCAFFEAQFRKLAKQWQGRAIKVSWDWTVFEHLLSLNSCCFALE